jgi:predicted RNA-binding protein with RPS1 domain
VRADISESTQVMVKNVEKVLERGDKIDTLVVQTDKLLRRTESFKSSATYVRKSQERSRAKLICIIAFGIIVISKFQFTLKFQIILYVALALICGPTLRTCIRDVKQDA